MSENNNAVVPAVTETSPTLVPVADRRPTAAESLAKQRAADKAAKTAANGEAKPAAKKSKSTTTVKKGKKAAKPAVTKNAVAPKTGLRKMQLRALKVLSDPKNADGLPIDAIAKKAGIGVAVMRRGLGAVDPASREAHDAREGFKSLVTLGHVRVEKKEFKDGVDTVYALSASGKKAADDRVADAIEKLDKPHARPYSVRTPAQVAKDKAKAAKGK